MNNIQCSQKSDIFIHKNYVSKCRLENNGNFVPA